MSTEPDSSSPASGEPVTAVRAEAVRAVGRPLSAEDLIALNEEIAGMARAGLPLDQGLATLAREMGRGRLRRVTGQLADDLRAGFTLPQALQRQEGRVPPYYAALLAAGIRSGRIVEVLGTLTLYARSLADFRSTLVTALLYPAMVLVLGLALLVFVGTTVLPTYADIFLKLNMRLPAMTKILLFVGEHVWEILVLPPVLLVVGLLVMRWLLRASPRGRVAWARFVYAVPLVGGLVRSARLAAFTDLLSILVGQAIPLPEALRLAAEASSDPLLSEGAKRVEANLNQGTPFADALQRERLVPGLVVWMTGFGERQGTLGASLHHLAEMYRRQAEVRATLLRTVLPPLLIICLAGILATLFIFGLLGPTYSALEHLGSGKS